MPDLSAIPTAALDAELRRRRGELPDDCTADDGDGTGRRFRRQPDGTLVVTSFRWAEATPENCPSLWPAWLTPEFCAGYRGGPYPGCPEGVRRT